MTWQEDQLPDWAKKEHQEAQAEIARLRAGIRQIRDTASLDQIPQLVTLCDALLGDNEQTTNDKG